ncbi:4Fe-4S dicluster domain-containing protein [Desulfobacterales bacterium HSG16]|nr:4Fe-4S dicluster domain-containing protein [Desulfobacterales bacterium HSG16]
MAKTLSRRSFLKGSVAAACTVAAASVPANVAASDGSGQLATLIDISKCVGCEECVYACRESNEKKFPNPEKPFPKMYPPRVKVEDWSEKKEVMDRLTPYNWLFIQHAEVTNKDGESMELTIPRRCMHCVNPPCVKLCPWGAAQQYSNGISRIDTDFCLGGSKCRTVCPWKIPQRQTGDGLYLNLLPSLAGNGIMNKCDRCYQKVAKGKLPACIESCPENVQTIGPRDEIIKEARRIAKETSGFIYGAEENGGTNTIYISPVSFEAINESIEKGRGKPHFSPVKNQMAQGNMLAAAIAIAPVAGISLAIGKAYKAAKKMSGKEDM